MSSRSCTFPTRFLLFVCCWSSFLPQSVNLAHCAQAASKVKRRNRTGDALANVCCMVRFRLVLGTCSVVWTFHISNAASISRFDTAVSTVFAVERSVPLPIRNKLSFTNSKLVSVTTLGESSHSKAKKAPSIFTTSCKCPENASLHEKLEAGEQCYSGSRKRVRSTDEVVCKLWRGQFRQHDFLSD